MQIVIDIPKEYYDEILTQGMDGSHLIPLYRALVNGTPHETVTEFADRCRECGKMGKGHWIPIQETIGVDEDGNEISVTVGYKCSDCGEKHESKTLYCPHCGARKE